MNNKSFPLKSALHIASASNAGYFPGLEVLVCSSLLASARDGEIHFHIFDGGLAANNWAVLRAHARRLHPHAFIHALPFKEELFAAFPALHGNRLTYARLTLADSLPHLDKVVYLDSDIIVLSDPRELRDLPMLGKAALAAPDAMIERLSEDCPWLPQEVAAAYTYFNAGVLVLDLARWRERGYSAQCLEAVAAKSKECHYYDQTALNYILRDDVASLPSKWNCVVFSNEDFPAVPPANLHLISNKPWHDRTPRFDHHVWRAFYADVIDGKRSWGDDTRLANKILFKLSSSAATQWLFSLGLRLMVATSRDATQKERRSSMLRNGPIRASTLAQLRQIWRGRQQTLRREIFDHAVLHPGA